MNRAAATTPSTRAAWIWPSSRAATAPITSQSRTWLGAAMNSNALEAGKNQLTETSLCSSARSLPCTPPLEAVSPLGRLVRVQTLAQFLATLEEGHGLGAHGHGLSGAGVAPR